mmetsp:Transcript_17635/g.27220  ORF Transcript_17635/g.27220 Transcript_17635/m.27220 type:complete len:150 (-) Transcript_17635:382-831(-)
MSQQYNDIRKELDQLFAVDAGASLLFGALALLSPHGILTKLSGGEYNHAVHEALRLYGCLRVACGWIIWNLRHVDDGRFRKKVCEALCVCYVLQALSVVRAQFTDRHTWFNWISIFILLTLAAAYGSFRFRKGGNLIKIYELPSASTLQ